MAGNEYAPLGPGNMYHDWGGRMPTAPPAPGSKDYEHSRALWFGVNYYKDFNPGIERSRPLLDLHPGAAAKGATVGGPGGGRFDMVLRPDGPTSNITEVFEFKNCCTRSRRRGRWKHRPEGLYAAIGQLVIGMSEAAGQHDYDLVLKGTIVLFGVDAKRTREFASFLATAKQKGIDVEYAGYLFSADGRTPWPGGFFNLA